jgi:ABC-2 type transport system ATP-binding protein
VNKGRLVTHDTPENLKYHFRKSMLIDLLIKGNPEEVMQFLRSQPRVRSVVKVDSTGSDLVNLRLESVENEDIREEIAKQIIGHGFGLLGLSTMDMSLEDIFVQLVTEEGGELSVEDDSHI